MLSCKMCFITLLTYSLVKEVGEEGLGLIGIGEVLYTFAYASIFFNLA